MVLFFLIDDHAISHASDAVGVGEDSVIVSDDDDGALGRACDVAEEFEHDLAVLGIEGGGLAPEDLNVSYYTAFNSVSLTESETEIFIPGTATVIPYGSGGPNAFDSMGNAFNPGDYLMQIRETATGMVIASFECPLNPAGEDVAF